MRRLIMVLLVMTAGPAWAEWAQFGETNDEVLYIDQTTINKDGQYRRVWTLTDLKAPNAAGDRSAKLLFEYDCKEQRVRILQVDNFRQPMAAGEITGGTNKPGDWRGIAPKTAAEEVLKLACAP